MNSYLKFDEVVRKYENDDLWPRDDPNYRYRLYALRNDGALHVLAAAPDPGGIGQAICTLHADARASGSTLGDEGAIGILDVQPEDGRGRGEWILTPFRPTHERNLT